MENRRCLHCGRLLPRGLDKRALYCTESHKSLAYRARKEASALAERFAAQQVKLCRVAPLGASAYKLGIRRTLTGSLVFFPRSGIGFRLYPFEPPRVPIAGLYAVEYFAESGRELGTPTSLLGGLYVEVVDLKTRWR